MAKYEIGRESWALLQKFAVPLEDTLDDVIRRCLHWIVQELQARGVEPSPEALKATQLERPRSEPDRGHDGRVIRVSGRIGQVNLPKEPPTHVSIGEQVRRVTPWKWASVLVEAVKYAEEQTRLRPALPIVSRTRFIVHTSAVHPNGVRFKNPERLGSGDAAIYVEKHWKRSDHCRNALKILRACGLADSIYLHWK